MYLTKHRNNTQLNMSHVPSLKGVQDQVHIFIFELLPTKTTHTLSTTYNPVKQSIIIPVPL